MRINFTQKCALYHLTFRCLKSPAIKCLLAIKIYTLTQLFIYFIISFKFNFSTRCVCAYSHNFFAATKRERSLSHERKETICERATGHHKQHRFRNRLIDLTYIHCMSKLAIKHIQYGLLLIELLYIHLVDFFLLLLYLMYFFAEEIKLGKLRCQRLWLTCVKMA